MFQGLLLAMSCFLLVLVLFCVRPALGPLFDKAVGLRGRRELEEVSAVRVVLHEPQEVGFVLQEALHVRVELVDDVERGDHVPDLHVVPPHVLLSQVHE